MPDYGNAYYSSQMSDDAGSGRVYVYVNGTSDSQPSVPYTPSWEMVNPDYAPPAGGTAPPASTALLPAASPTTFATLTTSVATVDYFGGLSTAGSSLLNSLTTFAGQPQAVMTAFERNVVDHVVSLPSIAGSLVSLAQVVNSYRQGDDHSVFTNAGNAIGGLTATEIAVLVISTASAPALGTAGALALASMAGGVFGALAGAAIHDMLTGKITEQQGDQLQAAAHTAMDRFYVRYPQYARYADQ